MSEPKKLTDLRREHGLSQKELAERLRVSRQAVSRWEQGTAVPSIDNLKLLSELYGVSMDELLRGGPLETERQPDAAPDGPSPAEEAVRRERRRGTRWKRAALGALLALAIALAALVYVVRKDPSGENRSTVSGVRVESVESVPTITFEVEDW